MYYEITSILNILVQLYAKLGQLKKITIDQAKHSQFYIYLYKRMNFLNIFFNKYNISYVF